MNELWTRLIVKISFIRFSVKFGSIIDLHKSNNEN